MRALISLVLISALQTVIGSCPRSQRVIPASCTTPCDPSTGCPIPGNKCLCDGHCGYSCVPNDLSCGIPGPTNDASVSFTETKFNSTAVYKCAPGFTVLGSVTKRCQANGKWGGALPKCMRACSILRDLPYGAYIRRPKPAGSLYFTGERLFLACNKGLKRSGNPARICIGGRWTKFPFECIGQHNCKRTIRAAFTRCTKACFPSGSDCPPNHKCLCDGQCGYSCVENGLTCGIPEAPENGVRFYNGTGYNDVVRYQCDDNYTMTGNPVRRCTAKKIWEGMPTSCHRICSAPPYIPQNAYIENKKDIYKSGERVTFKCKQGFKQHGLAVIPCYLGKWIVSPFQCKRSGCFDPGVPTHGRKMGVQYDVGSRVYFTCKHGFVLTGSSVRTCGPDFNWTGIQPTCKGRECGPMPPLAHGQISGNGTSYRTVLRFRCNPGYELAGSDVSICQASGSWSVIPTCRPVDCGYHNKPAHGSVSGDSTTFTSRLVFSCDSGYIMSGSPIRTCLENGSWSGTQPRCSAVDCGNLVNPANGETTGSSTTYGSTASVTCHEGYDLIGSKSRVCQADGTWSGNDTWCKGRECGPMPPLAHGQISGNGTSYRTVLRISCHPGYQFAGSDVSICQASGLWSVIPKCKVIDCGRLTVPLNGKLEGSLTTYSSTINITCDEGYALIGPESRVCQANGTWSGSNVTCRVIDCGSPGAPAHGSVSGDSTTFTSRLAFSCDAGYIMSGSLIRTCLENASWSGTQPRCSAVDCGTLDSPANGIMRGSVTTYRGVVNITCDTGFHLIGSHSRVCQANGTWSGTTTTCKEKCERYPSMDVSQCSMGCDVDQDCPPNHMCRCDGMCGYSCIDNDISCDVPDALDNGVRFYNGTNYNDTVRYQCNENYTMTGNPVRRCTAKKTWDGALPQCLPDCLAQPPSLPEHAYYVTTLSRYPAGYRLQVVCKQGYKLIGHENRSKVSAQCIMGQWSVIDDVACELVDCGPFYVHPNGSVDKWDTVYNTTIHFKCQEGFNFEGSRTRTCGADGKWTGTEKFNCIATHCPRPTTPANAIPATPLKDWYPINSSVEYKCMSGYHLKGYANQECSSDGLWSAASFACAAVTCGDPGLPPHASRRGSLFTYGSDVTFRCKSRKYVPRGFRGIKCRHTGEWSAKPLQCLYCENPMNTGNSIFSSVTLSASSERDNERHAARQARLNSNSAWCSARSEFAKYLQVDFGRHVEITGIATQGHPKEYKWVNKYWLRYTMGYYWFTYRQDKAIKVFRGNENRNTVVKHELKPTIIAQKVRIYRHQELKEFSGSTVCLRVEFYGCPFYASCMSRGASVIVQWYKSDNQLVYIRGYVTGINKRVINVIPSAKQRGHPFRKPLVLSTKGAPHVIPDVVPHRMYLYRGSRVLVSTHTLEGPVYVMARVYFVVSSSRVRVTLEDGRGVWRDVRDIRRIIHPQYCDPNMGPPIDNEWRN
ncbi:sushi, von Willebrand factor type A, EGF and pentraxin domain-containing protein 1 isoform X2 [Nematostella vectensis]|uniref:sushi, von Willebrand factor type A, EGF and pentraxin domain-containing protein 1 isoform X2 n=1 Tax=Nematostella vectensis TaxID=45351 RepID=UPI002076DD57|nr:sushi, von Willebrand factor type A, EGF and pentraxin domain-containing protein 1 isoform X2 [Nematostella vectensis]